MNYYEVAPTKIIRAGSDTFTYSSETSLLIGSIVTIEVGKKTHVGVVMKSVSAPDYTTKPIASILYETPFPAELLNLAAWLSEYYATPLAQVLQMLLPSGITKNRRVKSKNNRENLPKRTTFLLNEYQQEAVEKIDKMSPGSALLHGITGSGKTAVYVEIAKQTIAYGKSVMILVPEIALTSQLIATFSEHFSNILMTHSRQTEAERHKTWESALTANEPQIVIGPRSALFLPLKTVGFIAIDEAHEPTFKQEQSPRYSALRAASILADAHRAKLVLGSATPSVADYLLAEHSNRPIITMNHTARTSKKPSISIIDMTKRENFKRHRFFSNALLTAIETTLENGQQSLIFHNRRGSASTTLCENCGWQAGCPHCFIPLTLHADAHELRCHICGLKDRVPTSCPVCGDVHVVHKGIGTKLIEQELRKLFPNKSIARFDGDSASGENVDQRYTELHRGDIDIIIGTQAVAKGLDLPHLRTVGVVQADAGMSLPDYTSAERTFQLLAQVVGRVGRSDHATNLIMQSYQPTHPIVQLGVAQNYLEFYERTLKERKRANFPPFTYLLKLTCTYKTEVAAIKNAQKLASEIRSKHFDTEILGPTPAFYERQRDTYRWQITVKSKKRATLLAVLTLLPPAHWQFELDPVSLL